MAATTRTKKIEYVPIPCEGGRGYVALSIYPPGTFFNNKGFAVFVGGCGYGEELTLGEAEKYLYECALEDCRRQVINAQAAALYWGERTALLERDGLPPEKGEP